jgi:hypothetical protein
MVRLCEFHNAVGDLGQTVEVKKVSTFDLVSVEVLHKPLAEYFLGVGVLPKPDYGDLLA